MTDHRTRLALGAALAAASIALIWGLLATGDQTRDGSVEIPRGASRDVAGHGLVDVEPVPARSNTAGEPDRGGVPSAPAMAGESGAVDPQGIAFADPRIEANVVERQRLLEEHLEILREGTTSIEERKLKNHLRAASLLSAQIIYDVTGKSRYPPPPAPGEPRAGLRSGPDEWQLPEDRAYRWTSNGAWYEVVKGEFPVLDELHAGPSRSDEAEPRATDLVLSDVLRLADRALSYRVRR